MVSVQQLLRSRCKTALQWNRLSADEFGERNVSVLKCRFNETEADINATIEILGMLRIQQIDRCLSAAIPLICDAIYTNCDGSGRFQTRTNCLRVKNGVCKDFWNEAAGFINNAQRNGKCLTIPDCDSEMFRERKDNRTSVETSGKI